VGIGGGDLGGGDGDRLEPEPAPEPNRDPDGDLDRDPERDRVAERERDLERFVSPSFGPFSFDPLFETPVELELELAVEGFDELEPAADKAAGDFAELVSAAEEAAEGSIGLVFAAEMAVEGFVELAFAAGNTVINRDFDSPRDVDSDPPGIFWIISPWGEALGTGAAGKPLVEFGMIWELGDTARAVSWPARPVVRSVACAVVLAAGRLPPPPFTVESIWSGSLDSGLLFEALPFEFFDLFDIMQLNFLITLKLCCV
jgi:hypothetical protein